MKTAEEFHHTEKYIRACKEADPSWKCHCASCENVRLIQADATAETTSSPTWPYVLAFAKRMESKLEKNRHKGDRDGWLKDHPWNLVERILDETVEVQQCFANTAAGNVALITTAEEAADECADVANFCMMVADSVIARRNNQELL